MRTGRRLAALLALFALVAMPLRTVGACAMPAGTPDATAATEHEHHTQEPDAGEVPADAPHDDCPDLSGCAVVALGVARAGQVALRSGDLAPERARISLVDGPRAALDPPPPRR